MAHVHGEYLEVEGEEEENVELEMVVEEEASNDIEVILPDTISNEIKQKPKELEKEKIVRRLEFKDKKSAGKIVVSDINRKIYIFQNEFLCSNFSTHLIINITSCALL